MASAVCTTAGGGLLLCKYCEKNVDFVALNVLMSPVTTSVAEGSFRVMKGLLTYDRHSMSHDTPIGYLLAMISGDINKCMPSGALYVTNAALSSRNLVCFLCQIDDLLLCGSLFLMRKSPRLRLASPGQVIKQYTVESEPTCYHLQVQSIDRLGTHHCCTIAAVPHT